MSNALILQVDYDKFESEGYMTVTLDSGEIFKTKELNQISEILYKQLQANKLLEEASDAIDKLSKI